ncbi:glutamine amidotransferase-related protein, partial [Limosilactobacillus mucosae]|uniref:glutamine amidotransferase-related protein n=1 Tax=Limosilactobacillus mucosae TaxID=97478 RepID=UPI0039968A09
MNICCIQHEPYVTPGYYLKWAQKHQYNVKIVDCHKEKPNLQLADYFDMLVVLGGPQNPHTTMTECEYFDALAERETIQAFIDQNRMVVGVCLGAQLIGETLGFAYERSPQKEYGAVPVYLSEAGKQDELFYGFNDGALLGEWHNDMMGIGSQTPVLASSEGCPRQIVRYGSLVYGLQCHMELTPADYELLLAKLGQDVKRHREFSYVQSAEEIRQIDCKAMNSNLSTFLDHLVSRYYSIKT